jgi:NagD protein
MTLSPSPQRLRQIAHLALDLDGTVYQGGTLFPFSRPFLDRMRALGIGCTFLTNNPSKSAADYRAHLVKLGIDCAPEQIYTSALATIDFLRRERPHVRRVVDQAWQTLHRDQSRSGVPDGPTDGARGLRLNLRGARESRGPSARPRLRQT